MFMAHGADLQAEESVTPVAQHAAATFRMQVYALTQSQGIKINAEYASSCNSAVCLFFVVFCSGLGLNTVHANLLPR